MSAVRDAVDSLTGGRQAASAASNAARVQSESADKAIEFQKESRDIARADLQPFREAGESALPGLQELVNDPNAQLAFIQDNPFFDALTNQASDTLFANQAARGKTGSGGTAEELQNSLLRLGTDLVNQSIGQRQNLASIGSNAAAGQATLTQNTGNAVGNLLTQQGNAQAAGIIGARNAINEGRSQLLNLGAQGLGAAFGGGGGGGAAAAGALAACDINLKENIIEVGKLHNGLPVYLFNYKDDPSKKVYMNVMAQDVEKINPDAVIEIDNVKFVNMEKICH